MALPRGLKHFSDFFKNFENDYVIIGGTAASIFLEDAAITKMTDREIKQVIGATLAKNKILDVLQECFLENRSID